MANNRKDPELERLDPISEKCFKSLGEVINEELAARIAVGNDPSIPEECHSISELIADAILDDFVVRSRVTPRYRWNYD